MLENFTLAVASGKGGTGKTTIATNLALYSSQKNLRVQYLDCDVEEPNGHIFLKPEVKSNEPVYVEVPQVDLAGCTGCGKCGQLCQYNAIVCLGKSNVLTFEQLCHSCGGCMRVCPEKVISSRQLKIGQIRKGESAELEFIEGLLEIGNIRTPSLIRSVKQNITDDCFTVLDVPPGTSCPVVESLKGVDFVLLVTEPTPFGLNDLELAVELTRQMNLPFAVIINRFGIGDDRVERYCRTMNIDIAMSLPDDRKIAQSYSRGEMIVNAHQEYKKHFEDLFNYLEKKQIQLAKK